MKMEILRVSVNCCRMILVLEFRKWCAYVFVCVCVCLCVGTTYACTYCLTSSVILSVASVALLKLSSYILLHSRLKSCVYVWCFVFLCCNAAVVFSYATLIMAV